MRKLGGRRYLVIFSAIALLLGICAAQSSAADANFSFTDATAYDNNTALTWTRDAKSPGPVACSPGVTKNWDTATGSYIECLNSNNYLGVSDWRVPTKDELTIMAGYGGSSIYYNGLGFSLEDSGYYWSSTASSVYANCAYDWVMGINGGGIQDGSSQGNALWVWPVRGGAGPRNYTLTLQSAAGTGSITPSTGTIHWTGTGGTASYTEGTEVTLTPTPPIGSSFTSWSGCDSVDGEVCTVTMSADKSVTASFTLNAINGACGSANNTVVTAAPNANLCTADTSPTVASTATGWSWTCAGINGGTDASCSASQLFTFTSTTVYDNNTGLTWTRDAKSPGPAACSPGVTKDWNTATGTYIECLNSNNYLGVSDWRVPTKDELGVMAGYGGSSVYYINKGFSLNYAGDYWSSTASSVFPNHAYEWQLAMNGSLIQDGSYKTNLYWVWPARGGAGPRKYTVTLAKSGTGTGSITPSTGTIHWTDTGGTASYTDGTQVALTPTPAYGSSLTGWSGCDSVDGTVCTVTMSADKRVTAEFLSVIPARTLSVAINGSGTVNSVPGGIGCPGTCSASFEPIVTSVTLTAYADNTASVFSGWEGECASVNGTSCTVDMNDNKELTANFAAAPSVIGGTTPYQTLYDAFLNMQGAGIIKALARDFVGDLVLNRSLSFTLRGGYDAGYASNLNWTRVVGSLRVVSGSLTVERVAIR